MSAYKRILVGVDGSNEAEAALRRAVQFAKWMALRLVLALSRMFVGLHH